MHHSTLLKRLHPCMSKHPWLTSINHISSNLAKDAYNTAAERVSAADESKKDFFPRLHNAQQVSQLLKEAATFQDANDKSWATTPYPKDTVMNPKEETKPSINPKKTSVLLFPGQGIIKVGMVKKYLEFSGTKELFQLANEIIDFDLLKLCLNGPQDKLNRTEFNQAATVVTSLAALEKIRVEDPKAFETCVATAGYSVGEISALILSGAITFEDGVRLVWSRGKAMQAASDIVQQGMLSIHCTPKAEVSKACMEAEKWAMDMGIEHPICRVAIFLHTQQKILAGHTEALKFIEENQEKYGLARVSKLPVSGAFHTKLMEPALRSVFKTLSSIEINEPRCQVYSNYAGAPYRDLRLMKKYILKQIVSPVRWEQCLQRIYSRPDGVSFPQTYDVGSEGRMRTILKLINAKASRSCIVI